MLSKTSEVFASSLSLKSDENSAFGIYRNYFITFYEIKRFRAVDISCYLGDSDDNSINYLELSDSIKENIEKFRIEDYEISEGCVHLVSSADISLLRDMLDDVIAILKKNNIQGADYCSNCGKKFAAESKKKVVSINSDKHLLCDSCAFELMEESDNKSNAVEATKPSIAKLVLGAVLGALIGFIVYVALFLVIPTDVSGILQYFVCLAGLAVGGLSFCFARAVSKAGYSKTFLWTVVGVSAVFAAAAHYFGCVVYAVRLYANFEIFKFTSSSFFRIVFASSSLLRFYVAGTAIALCAVAVVLIFTLSSLMKKSGDVSKAKISVVTLK